MSKYLISPQEFRSDNLNVFTEEIKQITSSANADKGIQSIDSIEIYTYGTSKDLVKKV